MASTQLQSVYWLQLKSCKQLLDEVAKQDFAWLFEEPVDAIKLKWLDYHKIVKKPMDFSTIENRLSHGFYSTPAQFRDDMRLVFRNSMTYHPKGTDIYKKSKHLGRFFEAKWESLFDHEKLMKQKQEQVRLANEARQHQPDSSRPKKPKHHHISLSDQRFIQHALHTLPLQPLKILLRRLLKLQPHLVPVEDKGTPRDVYIATSAMRPRVVKQLKRKVAELRGETTETNAKKQKQKRKA